MSQADGQAWWAEVQDLRERIERRRGEPASATRARDGGVAAGPHRAERDGRAHEAPFAPRRTVRIRGQAIPTVTAPRLRRVDDLQTHEDGGTGRLPRAARRPATRPSERLSASPDRLALLAFAFALLLLLVAAISAHGL